MKFSGSKAGLKAGQKETANVLTNCAKYAETGLKILNFINEKAGDPTYEVNPQLQELYTCLYTMIRYLQEDHYSLMIASSYGICTQGIF